MSELQTKALNEIKEELEAYKIKRIKKYLKSNSNLEEEIRRIEEKIKNNNKKIKETEKMTRIPGEYMQNICHSTDISIGLTQ